VTQAARHDDVRFFQDILSEGAAFLDPAASRQLWKTIKKALCPSTSNVVLELILYVFYDLKMIGTHILRPLKLAVPLPLRPSFMRLNADMLKHAVNNHQLLLTCHSSLTLSEF
jgi:hypothetical protein